MKRRLDFSEADIPRRDAEPTTEAEWEAEADRRELELAEGRVEPITLEEVLDRLRARLRIRLP